MQMQEKLRILLVAVNAKYIHTCPAVYSLCAFARLEHGPDVQIQTAEFTINDRYQDVLAGIMAYHADIIGFSTYIWNVDRVRRLIRDIRRICGAEVKLWAGGPEATYYPEPFLREDGADLCMLGEGEETFARLVRLAEGGEYFPGYGEREEAQPRYGQAPERAEERDGSKGIAYLEGNRLVNGGLALPADMNRIPFLYTDLSLFENRILYYESSRGCPFSCAYCLSGRERGIRYRDLQVVKEELQFFLDRKVRQVKFIDRTFNADPEFAAAVWSYIRDHDNGITNFHFEIEADRFTDEELELVSGLRPGLIQMEIGVQSSNPDTLRSVHRSPKLDRVRDAMKILTKAQNINLHLDLIAGLPYEGMESFRRSFQDVYEMRPHQFQLGFLKLLKGTELYDRREEYGLVCSSDAPYEVLKTEWLSYEELEFLHRVSDRVEEYVNTQGFRRSLPVAEELFEDAFALFAALADYYHEQGYEQSRPSVQKRYEIFADFVRETAHKTGRLCAERLNYLLEMIRFDQALHIHPSRRMTLEEIFDFGDGPCVVRFDHRDCSPVNGEARTECIRGKFPFIN